ncbi:MAG: signal transduction histidine kinase [halophilic archaeon J07HB67]|jgi:Signal transduction histidine kinase|nr:MAG: signal transduction histidine kinase [halophilic archaeon J07HB67]
MRLLVAGRLLAGVAGGVLAVLAFLTHARRERAATSYAVLLGSLAVTALCAAVTAHTGVPYKLVWLGTSLVVPLALALFAFDYYGISVPSGRAARVVAVAPAVAGGLGGAVVVIATPRMSPGATAPVAVPAAVEAVGGVAQTLLDAGLYYTTAVMLVAVGLVVRTVVRYDRLDARLAPVVAFVGVWPWTANLFVPEVAAVTSLGVGVAAVAGGYTLSAVGAAAAVGPLGLFDTAPMAGNVGPEVVLDSVEECVVVVDDAGHVLRLNTVACETFGVTETAATAGPLSAVVGVDRETLTDGATVELDTVDGLRQFAVTRSAVRDREETRRGSVVLFRDVTTRRTREQRLAVLNRTLRHNLRNDASSIVANAELIGDGGDPETCADRIVDTTRELVDAAERAREIDRIGGEQTAVAISEVSEAVVSEVAADHPEVSFTTAVPDLELVTDRDALWVALRNVVDNAARHNDTREPFVVVSAEETGDGVELAVTDNGPGVPEHERAVLNAGEEDQLSHASGLGLWTAQWGVTAAGGRLRFSENDPRGTVVTLSLPTRADGTEARVSPAAGDG